LEGLRKYCPELLPWFRWVYGHPSPLLDSQGRVVVGSSEVGCRQGDPLAALLFCVAIQDALKKVSDMLQQSFDAIVDDADLTAEAVQLFALNFAGAVLSYMDDWTIAVPVCVLVNDIIATRLFDIFHRVVGLILNVDKCRFIGPPQASIIPEPVFQCLLPEGDIVLGSPVGTVAYRKEQIKSLTEAMVSPLPVMRKLNLDPQIVLNLIRYCVNTRAVYLARIQEDEALEFLFAFDQAIDHHAVCITAEHVPKNPLVPTDTRRPLCITAMLHSLPLDKGGLGIARHSWVAGQLGRLQSRWFSDKESIIVVIEAWRPVEIGENAEMYISNSPIRAVRPKERPDDNLDSRSQHCLLALVAYDRVNDLLISIFKETMGSKARSAWHISAMLFEKSGSWISPPVGMMLYSKLYLKKSTYLVGLRMRLLLHPFEEELCGAPEGGDVVAVCSCKARIKPSEPFHFLDCTSTKGYMKARHDAVVDVLARFLKRKFPSVEIQKELPLAVKAEFAGDSVRSDLFIYFPGSGRSFHIDVTVTNPAAPYYRALVPCPHISPDAANTHRDVAKIEYYRKATSPDITSSDTPHKRCYTFNVEATGRMGPSASDFIREIYACNDMGHLLTSPYIPSPFSGLLRELAYTTTKYNAFAFLFHKRTNDAKLQK
jgi:hypothetical protein